MILGVNPLFVNIPPFARRFCASPWIIPFLVAMFLRFHGPQSTHYHSKWHQLHPFRRHTNKNNVENYFGYANKFHVDMSNCNSHIYIFIFLTVCLSFSLVPIYINNVFCPFKSNVWRWSLLKNHLYIRNVVSARISRWKLEKK